MSNSRLSVAAWSLSAVFWSGLACAQDFPSKPIRIFTSAAGGGGDFTARQVAQGITGSLGQPVIVENRATGFIAAEIVAVAPPDGHTLTVQGSTFWILPLLRKMPYDVVRDFAPITMMEQATNGVVVHPSLPVKSIKELIALAKAKPGEINFGASALGSTSHLAGELFKAKAGVNVTMVPYKGAAPAYVGLLSGEIQLYFGDIGYVTPLSKANKVRLLAVTSPQPTSLAPGVPTMIEAGVPGYVALVMSGIWAPAKTPTSIISRLNMEVVRMLNRPEVKERYLAAGYETVGNTPQQFDAAIKADIANMSKVIKDANIKLD
jgi:tripartite-type tricarboxylate transporter receptor subunit TctC